MSVTQGKYGTNIKCPRCGGGIPNNVQKGQYPGALSRWDNLTEICSACGTEEAMLQWEAFHKGKDAKEVVDPINGAVKWLFPPE